MLYKLLNMYIYIRRESGEGERELENKISKRKKRDNDRNSITNRLKL